MYLILETNIFSFFFQQDQFVSRLSYGNFNLEGLRVCETRVSSMLDVPRVKRFRVFVRIFFGGGSFIGMVCIARGDFNLRIDQINL